MRPIVTDGVAWSAGWSVCHSREPCKNRWTDRDAVWVVDSGGPRNNVLGVSRSSCEGAILRGKGRPIVEYRDPLPWAVHKRLNRSSCCLGYGLELAQACIRLGAHWRHLENTSEPSICGGNASFCQITLTTCYNLFQTWLQWSIAVGARSSGQSHIV